VIVLLWLHIVAGVAAVVCGTGAVILRKGSVGHVRIGTSFFVAMLVLGITASILEPFRNPPGSPIIGVIVCYFVVTAWLAARRRDGTPLLVDQVACGVILLIAMGILVEGLTHARAPGLKAGPPGPVGLLVFGFICLMAGLGDVRYLVRGALSARQRITRHLWRMCFALFIATGSFFLGQQQMLPDAMRSIPLQLVLALFPLAVMVWFAIRVNATRYLARLLN